MEGSAVIGLGYLPNGNAHFLQPYEVVLILAEMSSSNHGEWGNPVADNKDTNEQINQTALNFQETNGC